MYTDAGHIVDTLIHILNSEQEFFRDYVLEYEPLKASRPAPLLVKKGIYATRPNSAFPLLEIEPDSEDIEWATTRGQRPQFNLSMHLTVVNSNPEFGVEYLSGWVRRVKVVLNDPRRLQAWVTDREGRRQYKFSPNNDILLPLSFLDSLITGVDYRTIQAGTLRQATLTWFCKVHESLPAKAFVGHWPHFTPLSLGPPNTDINGNPTT